MVRLTLYTRPGCHLCDTLKGVVDEIAREQPITLREVDITGDHGLERRFGAEIPVLTRGTRVIARVRATRAALIEALRGAPNS
jgi:hypothetical protein